MIWPFSLPPASPKYGHYLAGHTIDRAYAEFDHVILPADQNAFWDEVDELEHWCQINFCYYLCDRVLYNNWQRQWESNGIGGTDAFFICTNSDVGAVMASLRWS